MSVLIVLVAVAIIGGIVAVALGHGGELAREAADEPVTDFESWPDVAGYRPPGALLGYDARATQHALYRISRVIAERDAEIAWLRSRLHELQPEDRDAARRRSAAPDGPPAEMSPAVRTGEEG